MNAAAKQITLDLLQAELTRVKRLKGLDAKRHAGDRATIEILSMNDSIGYESLFFEQTLRKYKLDFDGYIEALEVASKSLNEKE